MPSFEAWLEALDERHRRALSSREFLKAVRALSARYVERRAALSRRGALDSAGKRSAFAAFYAPLHFLTTREVVRAIGAAAPHLETIVDLGCGTGAASAAWALEYPRPPAIVGIDRDRWALGEAAHTWRYWGLEGRTWHGDLAGRNHGALLRNALRPAGSPENVGILVAWTVNELDAAARDRLLDELRVLSRSGAALLVLEPLARRAAPWWDTWTAAFRAQVLQDDVGRRSVASAEWRFNTALPARLAGVSEAAGFKRTALTARSMYVA